MTVRAIFFDIDGTLVDSNDHHVKAWSEAFRDAGTPFDDQVIHDQIGKGTDMLVPTLLPETTEDEQEKLGAAHGAVFKARYLADIRPFPKAHDLLAQVKSQGVKVVLASSASEEELEHYRTLLGADDLVDAMTSSDDVKNTKPAPDIFAKALEKVQPLGAGEVLVIGDTPYDMEAASKCGIACIGVLSGKFKEKVLREAGAGAVYADVADLLAHYDAALARVDLAR